MRIEMRKFWGSRKGQGQPLGYWNASHTERMLGAIHARKKLHGKRLELLDEAGESPLTIMSFAAFLPPKGAPAMPLKCLLVQS